MKYFSFLGRPDGLGNRLEQIINLEYVCDELGARCEYLWTEGAKNRCYDILFECGTVMPVAHCAATYPIESSFQVKPASQSSIFNVAKRIVPKFNIKFESDAKPVGIHVRATDRINNESNHPHFMKSYDELMSYILNTIKIVNKKRPKYVFVSSEDSNVRSIFVRKLDKAIRIVEPICDGGIQSEYVDFFSLTLCSELWMVSRFSSFSITASLIGNIPINTFVDDKDVAARYKADFIYHK